ncbi:MAG TPA: outer membrane lipoprotein carrier protein LolA [Stellaceae bacterium]|jgi:outer membrane lipoprotein-sorting protein|nr:outer membrane lipoprotein carrier protein LolA [Stellaceae bacterium]
MEAADAMNWFWQICCASTATVLLLAGTPGEARAAPPPPPAALTPADSAELQKIAAYLEGIHTMTAHFQQATASGGAATGSVWLSRPGKMRFQYDPPNELLLLADAFYIYSWDPDLKQMSKVGLKSTPAWFLLREPISFTDGVVVTRFEHSGNTVRVTVVESAEPDAGSLTMVFSENPLVLRNWTVVDQRGRVTNVTLTDMQYGMPLDPTLFQYHDPYSR